MKAPPLVYFKLLCTLVCKKTAISDLSSSDKLFSSITEKRYDPMTQLSRVTNNRPGHLAIMKYFFYWKTVIGKLFMNLFSNVPNNCPGNQKIPLTKAAFFKKGVLTIFWPIIIFFLFSVQYWPNSVKLQYSWLLQFD